MNFMDAVKVCFSKYIDFTGRARRSEYWWWTLFAVLANLLLGWIPIIGLIIALGLILPGLAVTARRLHDTNRSGWWMLMPYGPMVLAAALVGVTGQAGLIVAVIGLASLAALVLLIVWLATQGTSGDNQFGPDPLIDDTVF